MPDSEEHGADAPIHSCDRLPALQRRDDGGLHIEFSSDSREEDDLRRLACRAGGGLLFVEGSTNETMGGLYIQEESGFYVAYDSLDDAKRTMLMRRLFREAYARIALVAKDDETREYAEKYLPTTLKDGRIRSMSRQLPAFIGNAEGDAPIPSIHVSAFDQITQYRYFPLRGGGAITVMGGIPQKLEPDQVAQYLLVERGSGIVDVTAPFNGAPEIEQMRHLIRYHFPQEWVDIAAFLFAFPGHDAFHVVKGRSGTGKGVFWGVLSETSGLVNRQSMLEASDASAQHFTATQAWMKDAVGVIIDEAQDAGGKKRKIAPTAVSNLLSPVLTINPKGSARYNVNRMAQLVFVGNDWPALDPRAGGTPRRLYGVYDDEGKMQKICPTPDNPYEEAFMTRTALRDMLREPEAKRYLLYHVLTRAAEFSRMSEDDVVQHIYRQSQNHRSAFSNQREEKGEEASA